MPALCVLSRLQAGMTPREMAKYVTSTLKEPDAVRGMGQLLHLGLLANLSGTLLPACQPAWYSPACLPTCLPWGENSHTRGPLSPATHLTLSSGGATCDGIRAVAISYKILP